MFQELSEFRDALLSTLYGNNIYQLVTNYFEKLSISHKIPNAPKMCIDLVLRDESVYNNLLGVPHNVDTIDQIAVIVKQLPPSTTSAIQISALTNPALMRRYDELKEYVTLVDERFKRSVKSTEEICAE